MTVVTVQCCTYVKEKGVQQQELGGAGQHGGVKGQSLEQLGTLTGLHCVPQRISALLALLSRPQRHD